MKPIILMMLLCVWKIAFSEDGRVLIKDSGDACWSKAVELQGFVKMKNGCTATGSVSIYSSNTTLDCNGGTIDLLGIGRTGVEINSNGNSMENIQIMNCTITNSKYQGMYIGWSKSDREKEENISRSNIYSATPRNILVKNVKIINPGSSGIYVDDYVQNVILDSIEITNPPAMAIYFEFSSRNNVLRNSKISGAGKVAKREAVSIDSSEGNLIEGNTFFDNPYGGVFIYKNCSEHYYTNNNQARRWMSADFNKIKSNVIEGSRVGVWVASRQSLPLQNAECGNGYYAEGKYTLDSAHQNLVQANDIKSADIGVIVEDDSNTVVANVFSDIRKVGVRVGTPIRMQYFGRPVINTKVSGNRIQSDVPLVSYQWGSNQSNN